MNVAEVLAIPASMFPERVIARFEQADISYADLAHGAARWATALRELGVAPGDRVAVLETNTPGVLQALFATVSLGAVFVPMNFRAREDELEHMLGVAEPSVLLVGNRYTDVANSLTRAKSGTTRLLTIERPVPGLEHMETLAAEVEASEPADLESGALALLMFTSGTTARPKAVMLAHDELVSYVFETTEPTDGSDAGTTLLAAPLHHIAGLTAVLMATFAGRRIVLMRQFESAEWLRLVEAERVTNAFVVPTMLKRIVEDPHFDNADLASLRVLSYGAAPMPINVIRRAIDRFPSQVQFINAFGQTETTSTVTMLSPEDHRLEGTQEEIERTLRRLGSIGRPLPDVEIRIVDESGRSVPIMETGEITIRSPRLMRGYYGETESSAASVTDGWLHTRDLGWMDEDGYVYLAGRSSDMIIRGGENIAPAEVESVLESHPAVDEAAVIGIPDEEWGERVGAIVTARDEISSTALIDYCRDRLASFKRPEFVFFVEALPRTATGKVLRKELRGRFAPEDRLREETTWPTK